ncbi:hypothetical protein BDN72DRAFT_322916 [Pluteus cervinus]|uniref:Uncharacterized protein n=1 Tax=Pluteus cervinus TaxID=181527 RepID=A0ACD3ACS6_9AGAR|nr:hypothetical protein BDN72DRAFT_322916 [Pluteus cervinus]
MMPSSSTDTGRVPPASNQANPLSIDKNESYRRKLVQCQYCMRSKAEGLTLSKCAGCRLELYCSKECQKKAWPLHKAKCHMNQRNRLKSDDPLMDERIKRLRDFTKEHGPTIVEAGIRALQIGIRPENAQEFVLALLVRERPSTRPELSYFVTDAEVVPIEAFGEATNDLREEMKALIEHQKHCGDPVAGAFIVTLRDPEHNLTTLSPTGYGASTTYDKPMPWREWVMAHMNGGILL